MANEFPRLRRAELQQHTVRAIHQGKGYQSSVYLVEVEGRRAAVKDFARAPGLFGRLVAPWLVSREIKALRHLDGAPGIPRFYGRVDRYAFALEFIEGTPVADFEVGTLPPEVFARVQATIDGIHRRGVSHGDLKRRSNLIVTPDAQVFLIDFAAALVRRRFNPLLNWLQARMAEIDDKSLPKIKKFAAPELMTAEDWEKLNTPTPLERWARRFLGR